MQKLKQDSGEHGLTQKKVLKSPGGLGWAVGQVRGRWPAVRVPGAAASGSGAVRAWAAGLAVAAASACWVACPTETR